MPDTLRHFDVTDPFGRVWQVEFRWLQNAISIRHCDAVDCKYYLSGGDERREMVIALMHTSLLSAAASHGRQLTDPWCMGVAALHLRHMISTWEDMDKAIATVPMEALERHAAAIEKQDREELERASLAH